MSRKQNVACIRCFKDKRLQEFIQKTGTKSHCPWCGARNTYVVPLEELGPLFRDVAVIYDPVEGPDSLYRGDSISLLLQDYWEIFSERIENASDDLMERMTFAILEAGLDPKDDVDEPDYQGSFERSTNWLEDSWQEEVNKLMKSAITDAKKRIGQNSLDQSSDPGAHEVAFEDFGIEYEEGKILYRARIHEKRTMKEQFQLHELGAPKPEEVKYPGRANRVGQSVLYLASDEKTALSEVRAWKGAPVAIARVRLKKGLWIINLKDPKPLDSPFFEELLDWKIQLIGLFHRFGEEFSRPIVPHEKEEEVTNRLNICVILPEKMVLMVLLIQAQWVQDLTW